MTTAFEAESAVIGSILIDDRCIDEVQMIIKPSDMEYPLWQKALAEAFKMHTAGQSVDPVILSQRLKSTGAEFENNTIAELFERTPTAANAAGYARIVKSESLKRELRGIGDMLMQDPLANPYETAMNLSARLADMSKTQLAPVADGVEQMSEFLDYKEKFDDEKHSPFVRTGYKRLDDVLGGGLLKEGLYILGARPGVGKSTFAINIADRIAARGEKVLFISLEMSQEQISAKRIARETRINGATILAGTLDREQYERMASAAVHLSEKPFYINRRSGLTVADISAITPTIRDLDIIVVDYLQLLKSAEHRKSRYEEITEISASLKSLARRLKIPILCLAQLSRETEKRKNSRPIMSDLRDSGAIEQDADGIIFLYRDDYYNDVRDAASPSIELEAIVAKNRHAGTGNVKLAFYRETSTVNAMFV